LSIIAQFLLRPKEIPKLFALSRVLLNPRDAGRPRLENPEDFVRIEVESALRFGKRVIPVLVQKTEMPRVNALPKPLTALALRHAVGLTHER
jgi:hypothetical protein